MIWKAIVIVAIWAMVFVNLKSNLAHIARTKKQMIDGSIRVNIATILGIIATIAVVMA